MLYECVVWKVMVGWFPASTWLICMASFCNCLGALDPKMDIPISFQLSNALCAKNASEVNYHFAHWLSGLQRGTFSQFSSQQRLNRTYSLCSVHYLDVGNNLMSRMTVLLAEGRSDPSGEMGTSPNMCLRGICECTNYSLYSR